MYCKFCCKKNYCIGKNGKCTKKAVPISKNETFSSKMLTNIPLNTLLSILARMLDIHLSTGQMCLVQVASISVAIGGVLSTFFFAIVCYFQF